MRHRLTGFVLFCFLLLVSAGERSFLLQELTIDPPFLSKENTDADSLLKTMSLKEKIGQLFMVAAYSNRDSSHQKELEQLITDYHIGGLIFFQGGPLRQAHMTNYFQSRSKIPLLIGMDAEWGLSMRLDSVQRFPRQLTLGALKNDTLIYLMGREIGRQCRELGVQVSFSPVADINNNAANPIIGFRSFGEDRKSVLRKSFAYMLGLQHEGIIAVAKHFPGHGDVDADSHLTLPVIRHDRARLDSLELYPFRELITRGLSGMMVAHLQVEALESSPNTPTTLSGKVVDQLLRKDMGFNGLVFTDALNMKGVSSLFPPGEVDLKALKAGNDILLFPEDVPKATEMIEDAVRRGEISEKKIEEHVLRILKAKYWAGCFTKEVIKDSSLQAVLDNGKAKALSRRLAASSLTLLENKRNILPLRGLDTLRIAAVSIGDTLDNAFLTQLRMYCPVETFELPDKPKGSDFGRILPALEKANLVIFGIHGLNNRAKDNYGVSREAIALINDQQIRKKVVTVLFGNPYALGGFPGASLLDGLIVAYENSADAMSSAAQAIFGATGIDGKLPVSVSAYYSLGDGMKMDPIGRMRFVVPEEIGVSSLMLQYADSIAIKGIQAGAYPGCQVLAAWNGNVFYNKSFGYHTYDSLQPVRWDDLYDLASVTKITASVTSLMKLQDEGKFSLDSTLSSYLPDLVDSTPYRRVNIRHMLAHQAGFTPWIPFFLNTLKKGQWKPGYLSAVQNDSFPVQVAENVFISRTYRDSIFGDILSAKISPNKKYLYSDVGYYFLMEVIQRLSGKPIDQYVQENFYRRLGAGTMTYNPLEKFEAKRITPQEDDKAFRKQVLRGYVHDQGAAMLGGVAGHAGVFGNAVDLAKVMQMLQNYGEYAGERFIKESTVKEFARCQFCPKNRRGAGFDRQTIPEGIGPVCEEASQRSFGHTGFTGITAWADPQKGLLFLFLSNRCYPIADNNKIIKMNIRTDIQRIFYRALSEEVKISPQ